MRTILVVDDDKENLKSLKMFLSREYKVAAVCTGEDALEYLSMNAPDMVLLDIVMPDMDGFEVLEHMRDDGIAPEVPVIFITADNDTSMEVKGLNMGAVDYIVKPFEPEVVMSRIAKSIEMESMRHDLEKQAGRDPLTGLWNRKYAFRRVERILSGRNACGAVFMMDIDNFKGINDTYGHTYGDRILVSISKTIQNMVRHNDIACRLGGDEFFMFFAGLDETYKIRHLASRLIRALNDEVKYPDGIRGVRACIGIAVAPACGTGVASLYDKADKALYYAKNHGKNTYHFYDNEIVYGNESEMRKENLNHIRSMLSEHGPLKGSYCVEYEGFKNIARFIRRGQQRNKRHIVYILFTIEDTCNGINGADERYEALGMLEDSVRISLRVGDVATRYSGSQIVAILVDAKESDACMVAGRILDEFHNRTGMEQVRVEYDIQALEEDEPEENQ